MMVTNLSQLKHGKKGKIIGIKTVGRLKNRLADMGILVGKEIKMEKIASLGDPIEITIKDYHLSLRKREAEGIVVEVIG